MATYIFKYNPSGTPEDGATQIKTLQYSTGGVNVTTGGWYSGVSDSGVYLITSDTTTTGLAGRTTGGGTGIAAAGVPTFWKTAGSSDAQLLAVVNRLPGSPGNLATVAGATAWLNSNNYGLFSPQAADSIRAALSTSVSAYDAATVGNFIKVTAAEYANVVSTVTDTTKYVMNDADLTSSFGGWTTGYNVSYNDTVNSIGTIPTSNYIIGYAYSGGFGTSITTYLRTGTTVNGTHSKIGSNVTFTDNGSKTVYFIRKAPTDSTASKVYLSFYTTGGGLGQVVGKSNYPVYYSLNADTNTWTVFTGAYPTLQALATTTKSW
jgi:hypothetical protein